MCLCQNRETTLQLFRILGYSFRSIILEEVAAWKTPHEVRKCFFFFLQRYWLWCWSGKLTIQLCSMPKLVSACLIYPNRNVLTLWCQRVSRCRFIMSNRPILQVWPKKWSRIMRRTLIRWEAVHWEVRHKQIILKISAGLSMNITEFIT